MCQDNSTEEPRGCEGRREILFYHGTPLFSVPSILVCGLRASVRSHGYVGLWCRDNVEEALTWCACPAVQYFPCVAIELAAWDRPLHDQADQEHGNVLQNRKTGNAYCIQVQCAKDEINSEHLPYGLSGWQCLGATCTSGRSRTSTRFMLKPYHGLQHPKTFLYATGKD